MDPFFLIKYHLFWQLAPNITHLVPDILFNIFSYKYLQIHTTWLNLK